MASSVVRVRAISDAPPNTVIGQRLLKCSPLHNHYLFAGASPDALMSVLDPDATSAALPHTVLIAPGGKIVWRHSGVIDRTEWPW